ncbi:MAG TPA: hypothetical protein VEY71_12295 [Chitinophagales bacterium]|nr:hypothetical protein [Chitinophagales bacterium]
MLPHRIFGLGKRYRCPAYRCEKRFYAGNEQRFAIVRDDAAAGEEQVVIALSDSPGSAMFKAFILSGRLVVMVTMPSSRL